MSDMKSVLLLGVFHSRKFDDRVPGKEPNRGQGFRDGVRSKALEDDGYSVRSLDDKHHEVDVNFGDEIHCTANFADARRMSKALKSSFGDDIEFDHVILDYFFSPIGWARERWTDNFWKHTIPMLVENNILKKGGQLWLPNLDCVKCSLDVFKDKISKYYIIDVVEDPKLNPLYAATEKVEKELLRCPDSLTNETQLRPLLAYSTTPFLVLSRRENCPMTPSTVTPTGRVVRRCIDIEPCNLSLTNNELSSANKSKRSALLKRKTTEKLPVKSHRKTKADFVVSPVHVSRSRACNIDLILG